ncbi:MAG: hypothetical protein HYV26_00760 [Candidatus Hydrogenedentes bacterium]|nr:hypothetical protein [Candidatus Hydrogenedentota bacterium]
MRSGKWSAFFAGLAAGCFALAALTAVLGTPPPAEGRVQPDHLSAERVAPPPGQSSPQGPASGMRAYLDAAGNFADPPDLPEAAVPDLSKEFTLLQRKDGLLELNFNGRLMSEMSVNLLPDGTLDYACALAGSGDCGHAAHGPSTSRGDIKSDPMPRQGGE